MVAFSSNLFCVLALALFPAIANAQMEMMAQVSEVDVVSGSEEAVVEFSAEATEGEFLGGTFQKSGSVSAIEGSPAGGRKLQRANAVNFDYGATIAITTIGTTDEFVATFRVKRTTSSVVIPVSLRITAAGGTQTVAIPSSVSVADNGRPAGTLRVISASLTTQSRLFANGQMRFTEYTFTITVDFVPNRPGTNGSANMTNGGVVGDPHFQTWAGELYDYQGQCEMSLLHSPRLDLDVHIRTKIRDSYSYVESVALRIANDILEVTSFGEYFFNGVEGTKLPKTLSSYPLTYEKTDKKHSSFMIQLDFDQKIHIYTIKDIVNFKFLDTTSELFDDSVGLMGSYGTSGRRLARDGITVVEDPNMFSQEWQVRDSDPKIFQSSLFEPQHPSPCILPDPVELEARRRLLENTVSRAAAEKACAHVLAADKDNCVDDIMVTGDLDMALNF